MENELIQSLSNINKTKAKKKKSGSRLQMRSELGLLNQSLTFSLRVHGGRMLNHKSFREVGKDSMNVNSR